MRLPVAFLSLAIAAGSLAACQNQAPVTPTVRPTTKPQVGTNPAATGQLSGNIVAPAGILASGGGNVIASGGGNVIASGGGNVIASGGGNVIAGGAGNYRLAQAELAASAEASASGGEQPLVGAEVFLADAKGVRVPGLKAGLSGKGGAFLFTGLDPAKAKGYQVVVMAKSAQGKELSLRSLANVGGTAKISLATTHATLAALKGLEGGEGKLFGQLKLDRFLALAEGYQKRLNANPPSVEAPETWQAWNDTQLEADASLKASLTEVSTQLKAAVEELKTALNQAAEDLKEAGQDLKDALGGLSALGR